MLIRLLVRHGWHMARGCPFVEDPDFELWVGDSSEVLADMPSESVDCCVTSPPYWGLRDYGAHGQIGLEPTPDVYVARLVDVFHEVQRVLTPHGTCWVNLGDSYNSGSSGGLDGSGLGGGQANQAASNRHGRGMVVSLKPKDLVGIPWRVAFALQTDGWYLRSDIVWSKPNPMPESVTDRPTKSHEYVFLLSKQPRYFFDQEAVREPGITGDMRRPYTSNGAKAMDGRPPDQWRGGELRDNATAGRNVRSVWEIATQPYPEAHFATYPEELVRRCLLAGCPEWVCRVCGKPRERIVERRSTGYDGSRYGERAVEATGGAISGGTAASTLGSSNGKMTAGHATVGWSDCGHNNYRPGVVLDPFIGSGTTAHVARKHGRHAIGIDLNADYLKLAARRLQQLSLFAQEGVA